MKLCMYVCVRVRKTKRNIFLSFFSFRQFTCIFSLSLSLSFSLFLPFPLFFHYFLPSLHFHVLLFLLDNPD